MNKKWLIIYILFFSATIISLSLLIISCQITKDKTPKEKTAITEEIIPEVVTPTPTVPIQTLTPTPTQIPVVTITPTPFEEFQRELIEVDEVPFVLSFNGVTEEYTINYETDFHDALGVCNAYLDNLKEHPNRGNILPNSEVYIDAKFKIDDKDAYVVGKLYYINEYECLWDLVSYDSENNPAYVKQYTLIEKGNNNYSKLSYSIYSYKDEIVFSGFKYADFPDSNISLDVTFIGKNQKEIKLGSEFNSVISKAFFIQEQFSTFKLYRNNLSKYDYTAPNGETHELDFSINLNQSFKLYQDYIIFEQSSPFSKRPDLLNDEIYEYYIGCKEMGGNFTQKAVYNLKRKGIEEVIIKAHTLSASVDPLSTLDLDISIKIKELNINIYKNKKDEFIQYAEENMVVKQS